MSRPFRHVVLVIALVSAAVAPARGDGEVDLEGVYLAEGLNPDGSEYRGVVQIVARGATYLVSWNFATTTDEAVHLEPMSLGVGISGNGVLAVSYYGEDAAGVVVYRIESGGARLSGKWTVAGDAGTVHTETLTRLRDAGPADPESQQQPLPPARRPAAPPKGTFTL